MFYLFVCLFVELRKNYSNDFHKIRWNVDKVAHEPRSVDSVAHEPRKNPLRFRGNPDHVTLK